MIVHTRIKVCGITRPEDALEAARLGADAVGLVFHEGSSRAVTVDQARAIRAQLPPFVTATALFLDATVQDVAAVLHRVAVDLLQFHGSETASFCESFGRPYIKAVPMGQDADPAAVMAAHPRAAGFLLDSHAAGGSGGTGVPFDWSTVPADRQRPLILAGGLGPENVSAAVESVQPWAVDVSSGVESAPGVKDSERMARFMSEVQGVPSKRSPAAGH